MIEEAHRSGDHEASILIQGRVYMLDFGMLQQINEDTGNHRPVRRQTNDKELSKNEIIDSISYKPKIFYYLTSFLLNFSLFL